MYYELEHIFYFYFDTNLKSYFKMFKMFMTKLNKSLNIFYQASTHTKILMS